MFKAQFKIGRHTVTIPYINLTLHQVIEEMASHHANFAIYGRGGELLYSQKWS